MGGVEGSGAAGDGTPGSGEEEGGGEEGERFNEAMAAILEVSSWILSLIWDAFFSSGKAGEGAACGGVEGVGTEDGSGGRGVVWLGSRA